MPWFGGFSKGCAPRGYPFLRMPMLWHAPYGYLAFSTLPLTEPLPKGLYPCFRQVLAIVKSYLNKFKCTTCINLSAFIHLVPLVYSNLWEHLCGRISITLLGIFHDALFGLHACVRFYSTRHPVLPHFICYLTPFVDIGSLWKYRASLGSFKDHPFLNI